MKAGDDKAGPQPKQGNFQTCEQSIVCGVRGRIGTILLLFAGIPLCAGCHGARTFTTHADKSYEVPVQWLTAHDVRITVLEVIDEMVGRSCQLDLNGTLLKIDHVSLNLDSVDRVDAFVWNGLPVLLFRGNTIRVGSGMSYDQAAAIVLDPQNDYQILHIPLHYTEFDMRYEISLDARYWPAEVWPDEVAVIRYEVEAWSSLAPDTRLRMIADPPPADAVTAEEMLTAWQETWTNCREWIQHLQVEYEP